MESLKYNVTYDDEGWRSTVASECLENLMGLVAQPASDSFVEALDCCCNEFYREIPPNQRPWIQHRDKKEECESLLKGNARKKWPLDWYWKVLVTCIPKWWEQDSQEIEIEIAQIRRWVLLTAYTRAKGDDGASEQRQLVRAPIFGRSDRIASWDQYWLYLLNAKAIEDEWESVKSRDQLLKAYLMGRHNAIYRFSKDKITPVGDGGFQVEVGGRLVLRTDLAKSTFVQDWVDVAHPQDLVEIPVWNTNGGSTADGESSRKSLKLLLASEPVCRTFEMLSDVWNDTTIRTLHINAPPGSGKEVLAESIYWFQDRPGAFGQAVWSSGGGDEASRVLFGSGAIDSTGLVEKTSGGCLVLDEIDKADEGTRSSLLRLLENGQYTIPGSGKVVKIEKGKDPLYILVSSKPLEEVLQQPPADLWTRVQLHVVMEHPLDVVEEAERRRVLGEYFLLFWNLHVQSFFSSSEFGAEIARVSGSQKEAVVGIKPVTEYYRAVLRLFHGPEFPILVSQTFAKLCSRRFQRMSVRHVRTIAQRCVFRFIQELVYNSHFDMAGDMVVQDRIRQAHQKIDKFLFAKEFEELVSDSDVREEVTRVVEASLGGRMNFPG